MSASIERVHRLPRLSRQQRARRRRKPAMALHRALRRPRIVGRRRRSDAEGFGRRLGAVSGARYDRPGRRAPRHAGSAEHPARRRRAGVPRAVGGAGLRHDAGAARARAVHLGRNGRRRSPPRSSARKAPAIPTPARPIIRIGWRRWRSWSPKRASTTHDTLHRYRDAWDRACDRTPHGQPIELKQEDFVY